MTKPAIPAPFGGEPFPRIRVDQSEGGPFARMLRIGVRAADAWVVGPDGPYKKPGQTGAATTRGLLRDALLYLLELGVVDIDEQRLEEVCTHGAPMGREAKSGEGEGQ